MRFNFLDLGDKLDYSQAETIKRWLGWVGARRRHMKFGWLGWVGGIPLRADPT